MAQHIRGRDFVKVADLCHNFANWSWLWIFDFLVDLQKCLIEFLQIILDELIVLEGHNALLLDNIGLSLLVESGELSLMNFFGSFHGRHGGCDVAIIGEQIIILKLSALNGGEVVEEGNGCE